MSTRVKVQRTKKPNRIANKLVAAQPLPADYKVIDVNDIINKLESAEPSWDAIVKADVAMHGTDLAHKLTTITHLLARTLANPLANTVHSYDDCYELAYAVARAALDEVKRTHQKNLIEAAAEAATVEE